MAEEHEHDRVLRELREAMEAARNRDPHKIPDPADDEENGCNGNS